MDKLLLAIDKLTRDEASVEYKIIYIDANDKLSVGTSKFPISYSKNRITKEYKKSNPYCYKVLEVIKHE